MAGSPTYSTMIERFLQRLANEGRSPSTLAAYRTDLDDTMIDVCIELGLLADRRRLPSDASEREAQILAAYEQLALGDITADHLDGALAEFRTRPDPRFSTHPERGPDERSPATVARRTSAIRSFFAWAYKTQRIPNDPAALLSPPRRRKRVPRALEQTLAGGALSNASSNSQWPERDALILALALACGLRLGEIAGLKLVDLEGDPPYAMVVRGKGDKERRLGVPPIVADALSAYLPTRVAKLDELNLEAQTVVISSRPRPVKSREGKRIGETVEASRESVVYVVDRVLRSIGARRPGIRVHALRHTFATLGLREGAFSLRQLQVALGHASLATTQIYTEVADEEIAQAMRLHPLADG
jgi:integrase/recombinase XerC